MKPVKVKSKAQDSLRSAAVGTIAGRHSAIVDSEQDARELQRLIRALKRARGFALYFARCNLPASRSELLSRLKSSIARPIVEIELNSGDIVLDVIEQKSKNLPENVVLSISGLEHWLPTENRTLISRTLRHLNLQRSAFQRLHRPLLFWLPEYAIPLLAEGAPDFWDWHSGLYEFSAPQAIKAGLLLQLSSDSTYWADWSLSEAEKHDRILLLLGLLDEYQGDSAQEIKARSDTAEKLARIYFSLGNYDDALRYLQTVLQAFEKLGDQRGIAQSYNNIGVIYKVRGDFDQALKWYQKALAIQEQIGDRAGLAITYNNIAAIHYARGDFDHALEWLQKSRDILEQISNRAGLATTYNNIASIHRARGDFDSALEWYRKSVEIQEQLGDRAGLAASYNNIGLIYKARGDYDNALEWLQKSRDILEQISNRAGLAATYNNIGEIHRARGDYDSALEWYRKSVDIYEQLGDRAGLATTLHNMGYIAIAREDWPTALACFARSRDLFREIGLEKDVEKEEKLIAEVKAKLSEERGA